MIWKAWAPPKVKFFAWLALQDRVWLYNSLLVVASYSVEAWWASTCDKDTPNRQAKASLAMLVSWTIWNERNARVFKHKSAPPTILLASIETEANLWVIAGAKKLWSIILRE